MGRSKALQTFLGIILGGSFLAFIEFLINRHDKRNDKLNTILEKITSLEKKVNDLDTKNDEQNAINARIRILRFADDLMDGRERSKESYDQCLEDVDTYEKYCGVHHDFQNGKTVATIAYIRSVYGKRLERHDFITR